jgi:hypothetical protein
MDAMLKYIIAAAALATSTGAIAQSTNTQQPAAKPRHAVLENIISRVQMDALISKVVATDVPVTPAKLTPARRSVVYAASAPVAVR